ILDIGTSSKYASTPCTEKHKRTSLGGKIAAVQLSSSRAGHWGRFGAVFPRLGGTSKLRRLLADVGHRRSLFPNPGSGLPHGRLVRHFHGRDLTQLRRNQGP